ncbi:MAG: c-type cytochrome [Rhodobacteraceae bacterium]|nr:c-type cytochrome [Paracoccaceae bacterium]
MGRFLTVAMVLLAGPAAAQDAGAGAQIYLRACAACHGLDARGEGEMAAILTIAPPDLTALAALNGGVFPVARAAARIDGRDPLLAHGGEMPVFGDWLEGEETMIRSEAGQPVLVGRALADLLAFLAAIQE